MTPRRLGAAVAGLAIAALFGAPSAQAKPGYVVFPGSRENTFSAKGTNGFRVTVSHIGRRVELTASKGDAAAIYLVGAAKPSPKGNIEATFPGRGRVSVRFAPSGPAHRTPPFYPPECNGGGEVRQRGTFRGTIRFWGEQRFTRIVATSARGFVRRAYKEVCRDGSPDSRSQPDPTYSLSADAWANGRLVSFTALRPAPGSALIDESTYFGSSFERRRGMSTVKVAVAHADEETFAVAGPPARPSSANVAPPAPFRGTASFEQTAEGRLSWEGTLAVDLPGIDGLPLAGPVFQARLCFNQRCTTRPIPATARRWLLG